MTRMRLGAMLAHLSVAEPRPVVDWARRLADAGFQSLWIPQLIGRAMFVPDPFVTLAAAAVATRTIPGVELGTATVQVPLHHPVDLAHRIRSVQLICGDRLSIGLSPGSTATDFAALDQDFPSRFRTFGQRVGRLRGLLTDGHDDGADLGVTDPVRGCPPLLLGSWGANVERAAREFDGWLASGYRRTPEQIIAAHQRFRAAGGRRAIVTAVPVAGPGDLPRVGQELHRYADAGFDDAVVLIEPAGPTPELVRALFP